MKIHGAADAAPRFLQGNGPSCNRNGCHISDRGDAVVPTGAGGLLGTLVRTCKAVGPIMDALAKKYLGRLKVAKLNLDENPVTGSRYSISSVPTMLLVKNGKLVNTLVGALPQNQIESAVNQML